MKCNVYSMSFRWCLNLKKSYFACSLFCNSKLKVIRKEITVFLVFFLVCELNRLICGDVSLNSRLYGYRMVEILMKCLGYLYFKEINL